MKKHLLLFLSISILFAEPNWEKTRMETVDLLQQYLRIDTSNPLGDVRLAAKWFADKFTEEGISFATFTSLSLPLNQQGVVLHI